MKACITDKANARTQSIYYNNIINLLKRVIDSVRFVGGADSPQYLWLGITDPLRRATDKNLFFSRYPGTLQLSMTILSYRFWRATKNDESRGTIKIEMSMTLWCGMALCENCAAPVTVYAPPWHCSKTSKASVDPFSRPTWGRALYSITISVIIYYN